MNIYTFEAEYVIFAVVFFLLLLLFFFGRGSGLLFCWGGGFGKMSILDKYFMHVSFSQQCFHHLRIESYFSAFH